MLSIRKTIVIQERVYTAQGKGFSKPLMRVAALCAIANPFAGRFVEDLTPLFEAGAEVGAQLSSKLAALLEGPVVSYGKGAIVGLAGEMEHGAACIHPRLGKPMRAAIGGGQAVIPSNVKVAPAGTFLDVPLGHKDDVWSFDHFDTMTLCVADAPRPDEIVIAIVLSDGGRLNARSGKAPKV